MPLFLRDNGPGYPQANSDHLVTKNEFSPNNCHKLHLHTFCLFIYWIPLRLFYWLNAFGCLYTEYFWGFFYWLNTFGFLCTEYFWGFFPWILLSLFLFAECFWGFGRPASGIARGRLWSVQLELMDEISRDSLTGTNFTKGRGFSGYKVFEIFFVVLQMRLDDFWRKGKFEVFVITWRFPKGG